MCRAELEQKDGCPGRPRGRETFWEGTLAVTRANCANGRAEREQIGICLGGIRVPLMLVMSGASGKQQK
jgi:hypothetical protein